MSVCIIIAIYSQRNTHTHARTHATHTHAHTHAHTHPVHRFGSFVSGLVLAFTTNICTDAPVSAPLVSHTVTGHTAMGSGRWAHPLPLGCACCGFLRPHHCECCSGRGLVLLQNGAGLPTALWYTKREKV